MTTAYPSVIDGGSQLAVMFSFDNGNTYTSPAFCTAKRGFKLSVSYNTDEIVDTNAPANAAVSYRSVKAQDSTADLAGLLDANSVGQFVTWAAQPSPHGKPAKIIMNYSNSTANSTTISGLYVLNDFTVGGDHGKLVDISMTISQAGPITVVNA